MENLLQLRKSKRVTQKDVADYLGISRQAYANYETGNREPDIGTIVKMAHYFEVSVDHLLGFSGQKNEDLSEPDKVLHDVANLFYDENKKPADEGELSENEVVYNRNGKTERRTFTKEQLALFYAMLDAMPESPKDI